MELAHLIPAALEMGASDCHLSAGRPPMVRVHGELKRVREYCLSDAEIATMLDPMMNDGARQSLIRDMQVDFAATLASIGRLRVNVFRQHRGLAAVLRFIPEKVPPLAQLGMPPVVQQLCGSEQGLILVTGPTGSGKSTTLAGMIDFINENARKHILTIEDPIEYIHASKQSLVTQREVGGQTRSFAMALRGALRQDPDVVMVGEIRDHETTRLALSAAETGHLVLGTMHGSGAADAVTRIVDMFPPAQQAQIRAQFAGSFQGVIHQILLKKRTEGRVPAVEIMTASPAVRNLLREGKTHQLAGTIQLSRKDGMQTMEMAVAELLSADLVGLEAVKGESREFGVQKV